MNLNLDGLRQIIETWGYLMVFAGIAIESTGIPFPGETVLLVASAIAAGSSRLHIEWVILWAAAGAIIGDSCGYWAGRELGRRLLDKIGPWFHFTPQKQARLERYFEEHGSKTVFIGRFIAVLRAWAAFFAGMNRMHYYTFLLWNALGGITWAVAVGLLGYFFGYNISLLEKWLGDFSFVLLGLVLAGGIVYFVIRRRRREEKVRAGRPEPE